MPLRDPFLIHELDASGNLLEAYRHKREWTCWQALTGGEEFPGKRPIFGQLVFYKDKDQDNALMPNTSPGLFIGWRLESGLRYRGVLYVADYEIVREL